MTLPVAWLHLVIIIAASIGAICNWRFILRQDRLSAQSAWSAYGICLLAAFVEYSLTSSFRLPFVFCALFLGISWMSLRSALTVEYNAERFFALCGIAMPAIFLSAIAYYALSALPPIPPKLRLWSNSQVFPIMIIIFGLTAAHIANVKNWNSVSWLASGRVVKFAMCAAVVALVSVFPLFSRLPVPVWAAVIMSFTLAIVAVSGRVAETTGSVEAPTILLLVKTWRPVWIVAAIPVLTSLADTDFSPVVIMFIIWVSVGLAVGQIKQTLSVSAVSALIAVIVYCGRWPVRLFDRIDIMHHPFSSSNAQLAESLWNIAVSGPIGRGMAVKPRFSLPATDAIASWIVSVWGVFMLIVIVSIIALIGYALYSKALESNDPYRRCWLAASLAYLGAASVLSLWPGGHMWLAGTAFPLLTGGGANACIMTLLLSVSFMLIGRSDSILTSHNHYVWPSRGLHGLRNFMSVLFLWALIGFIDAGVARRTDTLTRVFNDRYGEARCRNMVQNGLVTVQKSQVVIVLDRLPADTEKSKLLAERLNNWIRAGALYERDGKVRVRSTALRRSDPSGFGAVIRTAQDAERID